MAQTQSSRLPASSILAGWKHFPQQRPVLFLLLSAVLWALVYSELSPVAAAITAALPLDQGSHLAAALRFLIFEAPKVLLLLTAVVMVMGMINSWFTPERTRTMLAGNRDCSGGQRYFVRWLCI